MIAPSTYAVNGPVVEDSGSSVASAETFGIHASFTKFLAKVEHEGVASKRSSDDEGCTTTVAVACKEITGQALLVVVLKEVEHVVAYVVDLLPLTSDFAGLNPTLCDGTQAVVHAYLIIKVVEMSLGNVSPVLAGIIDFGDEEYMRIEGLDLGYCPLPELYGYHLGHVAAEGIDALFCPIEEDVEHLLPCAWYGIEIRLAAMNIVDAVVKFDSFVPVVLIWLGCELVVACCFCGHFGIALHVYTLNTEVLARQVVEIVVRGKFYINVIVSSKFGCVIRKMVAVIKPRYMVGHEIHNDAEASLVGTLDKAFKLSQSCRYACGNVRGYIIVVLNGIGRTRLTLNNSRMVGRYAIKRIVCLGSVLNEARVPDVRGPKAVDLFQRPRREVGHATASVSLAVSPWLTGTVVVTK